MAVSSVRDILRAAAHRWGLAPAARLAAARAAWPEVAGVALAEASAPATLRGRTMLVAATSSTAAQEIRLRGPAIVRALARALREDAVERVVPVIRERLPRAAEGRSRVPSGRQRAARAVRVARAR